MEVWTMDIGRNSNVRDVLATYSEVELKGSVYKVDFSLYAFALIEDDYGDVDTLLAKVSKGSAKATIALLWAGLQTHHPGITRDEVGVLANLKDMAKIASAIYANAGKNIPQPKPNRQQRRAAERKN
jgi:hypothetical protein